MTHDPLCWELQPENIPPAAYLAGVPCCCELIAQVRADMLQRVVNLSYYHDPILPKEHGYNEGREDAIDVLSKAVLGL